MVEAYWTDKEPDLALYCGDNRIVMPELDAESVDSIITDPPYELGFMGKGWDRSGIAYDVDVWRECLRVLKPGGHLLAFGGSRTYHRLACAIEDAGFEIRDQIQWLYGSGFPKSLDISKQIDIAAGAERELVPHNRWHDGRIRTEQPSSNHVSLAPPAVVNSRSLPSTDLAKQWEGWGTALKPAHEPLVLARKPLIGTVVQNILEHGTGGLNIAACRIGSDTLVIRGGGGGAGTGWGLKREINVERIGRFPANVIHDGSEEVLAGFPETGEGRFPAVQNTQSWKMASQGKALAPERTLSGGSAARFFYCAKADQSDRNEGLEDLPIQSAGAVTDRRDGSDGLNSPRAGAGRTNGSRNFHPTIKPTDLMRYLCRLITPPGGLVLDPFCGSGSTGKAARAEGFRFIGIEISEEYCALARARCEIPQRSLWGE